MMSVVRSQVFGVLCLALLVMVPGAHAQSVSGTILGTVTDPTGAVIANAKVTIVNEGTGLTRTVTTDANGEYTAPSLPTGRYTVMAEITGFKTLDACRTSSSASTSACASTSSSRSAR